MKTKIYRLYRLAAKLNLYFSLCDAQSDRIEEELKVIKNLAKEILEQINEQKKRDS